MATELLEAAETMLTATSGMYIEYVSREEDIHAAENWLEAAISRAEPADEAVGDVLNERARQVEIGFAANHDLQHDAANWHNLIIFFLVKGVDDEDFANEDYRKSLVQAAALTIAAIQAYDRKLPDAECDAGCRRLQVPGKRYCALCRREMDKNAAFRKLASNP